MRTVLFILFVILFYIPICVYSQDTVANVNSIKKEFKKLNASKNGCSMLKAIYTYKAVSPPHCYVGHKLDFYSNDSLILANQDSTNNHYYIAWIFSDGLIKERGMHSINEESTFCGQYTQDIFKFKYKLMEKKGKLYLKFKSVKYNHSYLYEIIKFKKYNTSSFKLSVELVEFTQPD